MKFDAKTGQFSTVEFPPHYMIYAPGVSNADIGVAAAGPQKTPGLPFIYAGYSVGHGRLISSLWLPGPPVMQ